MATFFKWLPGAVMGLLAFCAGVSPNEAASHLADWVAVTGVEAIPPWLSSPLADRWGFYIGLVGLCVWGLAMIWNRRSQPQRIADILYPAPPLYKRIWWRITLQTEASRADKEFDKRRKEFISLREAATRLYSECLAKGLPLAKSAEHLRGHGITPGTSDDILNWVALNISLIIPIRGRRPPSTIPVEIQKDELRSMVFKAGGAELYGFSDQSARYNDLEIKLADLNKHIDGLGRGMEIPE